MLLWHFIIKIVPRKKAWQGYSLVSVFSFAIFMICGEGSMSLLVIFSVLNAMPAGGAYLNDVFVSDIIDYDEFLTGKRNEGIYVVFSSFIPKIVTILAQSLPLTIMSCITFFFIYRIKSFYIKINKISIGFYSFPSRSIKRPTTCCFRFYKIRILINFCLLNFI